MRLVINNRNVGTSLPCKQGTEAGIWVSVPVLVPSQEILVNLKVQQFPAEKA
jgi:hypothetical protein